MIGALILSSFSMTELSGLFAFKDGHEKSLLVPSSLL